LPAGCTDACLPPNYKDPEYMGWDFTYTENHWSNAYSMERYAEKIINPYLYDTIFTVSWCCCLRSRYE